MRASVEFLPAGMTVTSALERAQRGEFRTWLVSDEQGLLNVVSLKDLEKTISEGAGEKRLVEILHRGAFPHLHADQSLDLAIAGKRMGAVGLDLLPVVSRANVHDLEGIIVLRDILEAYGVAGQ